MTKHIFVFVFLYVLVASDILKEYDKTYFRVCVFICQHVMWQTDQASGVGAECMEGRRAECMDGHRAVKRQVELSGQLVRAYNAPAVFGWKIM